MLSDTIRMLRASASALGNYEALDETTLANGYCDAEEAGDMILRDAYYSALMLRYKHKIFKYYETSQSTRLPLEEFVNWLHDALEIAFRYREWRNPESKMYYKKDPRAVDKIINRCCFSVRGLHYQYFNKDKRKVNYISDSLDRQIEVAGDAAEINFASYDEGVGWEFDLIQDCIKLKNLTAAVILDNIAYGDSFNENRETVNIASKDLDGNEQEIKAYKYNYTFDKKKLVKLLASLDDQYFDSFSLRYALPLNDTALLQAKWKKLTKKKLYSCIDTTLNDMRTKVAAYM